MFCMKRVLCINISRPEAKLYEYITYWLISSRIANCWESSATLTYVTALFSSRLIQFKLLLWWKWSNLLSWGHMYQRLQRWVLDAKSMLTLAEVAVTTSVPCWVEIKHSAVVVGVGRHEPIRGLVLLVVIVIIVVFSVVVVGVALTESALTEWSLMKEGCVRQRKK